tara:strand:- start:947 stop:1288 length:342 start_codon:yes stop_codon:yes gene_type:complete
MLTKQELIDHIGNYVVFDGFTDQENLLNNNCEYRTDWHSDFYLYCLQAPVKFPYNNKKCKVLQQCEDGSIECEFDERDFMGNIIGEKKAIISFEFSENSNGLIDYDPIFSTIN